MESLEYILIIYQCLGPPYYLSAFGANRMSTKIRIDSTWLSPADCAKKFSFVSANNQPVTTTTCCHLSSLATIFILKSPVVTILYLVTLFPLLKKKKFLKSFLNLIQNDTIQKIKIKMI